MRNRILLYAFFLIPCLITFAGNIKKVSLMYGESDFSVSRKDSTSYISGGNNSLYYSPDTSLPCLPYVIVQVLIGPDDDYENVSAYFDNHILYEDVILPPNATPVSTNSKSSTGLLRPITYSKSSYPDNRVIYNGTHIMDGYKYLSFLLCPFTYQPERRELYFFKSVSLNIHLRKGISARKASQGRSMRNVVSELVINHEELSTLYPDVNQGNLVTKSSSQQVEYLIITCDSLKRPFKDLAHWKCIKGVKTRVVSVEDIYSANVSEAGKPLEIKNYIKDYYNTYGIKYVLLGGDVNIIPSPQCYIRLDNSGYLNYSIIPPSTTPCDYYYACWGGTTAFNWNRNNDLEIGEIEDSICLIPQVNLTRLSVRDAEDASVQISRIIDYELHPDSNSWNNKVLMTGSCIDDDDLRTINGRLMSDAEYKGEQFYITYFYDDNIPRNRYRLYDTWTDHPMGASYQMNPLHLRLAMNDGYSYIHMDTHGDYNHWKTEGANFTCTNAHNLVNPRKSIIVTSACHTNSIDSTECLSEAFMRTPTSGILAYFGSSREGLYADNKNYSIDKGASDLINKKFYYKLFYGASESPSFGEIATWAKSEYAGINYTDYTDPLRFLLFTINPLGDPEMPIFRQVQEEIPIDSIVYDDEISIKFSDDIPRTVHIMSLDDDGDTYDEKYTYYDDSWLIIPDVNCSVCITHPGNIPYVINFIFSDKIQNQTLIGNKTFCISNNLNVGKDVNNLKPEGPVIIEKGKTYMFNSKGTIIKNSFMVKKGATLEIKPQGQIVF